MAAKTINTRIQLKNDTEANWKKSVLPADNSQGTKVSGTSFVPLLGELIIFSADDAHPFSRLKVGNGTDDVLTLPFIDAGLNDKIIIKTTAEWQAMPQYIPPKGTILIYSDRNTITKNNTTYFVAGIKLGNGQNYGIDLPFIGDDVAAQIMAELIDHINDQVCHITNTERTFWNNKLNCDYSNETLIFNRI